MPYRTEAFADAHSHISGVAAANLQADLSDCRSFDEIVTAVRKYITDNSIKKGEYVTARGYDTEKLKEHRHPDTAVADLAAPDNPVAICHMSGHSGVFGSRCASPGFFEEDGWFKRISSFPAPDMNAFVRAFDKAQTLYASYGFTVAQEGFLTRELIPLYRELTGRSALRLSVVGYADFNEADEILSAFPRHRRTFENNFMLAGIKIFLDGSPQSGTAWMSDDTEYSVHTGRMSDSEVIEALEFSVRNNLQLIAHCNGSEAARQLVRCAGIVFRVYPRLSAMRTVMIHAQFLPPSIMGEMRIYGIIPSFFASHINLFGDLYAQKFGKSAVYSPCGSAMRSGLIFTLHEDSPVLPPNPLAGVCSAVTRLTRNGMVAFAEEAVSVADAMNAVSGNVRYCYNTERRTCDYVILESNPNDIPACEIRNIRVLYTERNGIPLYENTKALASRSVL